MCKFKFNHIKNISMITEYNYVSYIDFLQAYARILTEKNPQFIPVHFHLLQAIFWGSSYEYYDPAVPQPCPSHLGWLMELPTKQKGT